MNSFLILHGPNLNLLGTREPDVYGRLTLEEINQKATEYARELGVELRCLQSNHEGALIDALHELLELGESLLERERLLGVPVPILLAVHRSPPWSCPSPCNVPCRR